MRKMVCLVLVFVMVLGMLPTRVFAMERLTEALGALGTLTGEPSETMSEETTAETLMEESAAPDLLDASLTVSAYSPLGISTKAVVEKAFQDYVNTLPKATPSEGTNQMINHATSGGGKKLVLKKNDPFYAALVNSRILREDIVMSAAMAIDILLESWDRECILKGSLSYYSSRASYNTFACKMVSGELQSYDPSINTKETFSWNDLNSYDEALLLVVGYGVADAKIQKTVSTLEEITFRVNFTVSDDFNFDAEYTDANLKDDSLASLLTSIGKLLSLGILKPYTWTADISFDVTVPNPCAHETVSSRWETGQNGLQAVAGKDLCENPLDYIYYMYSEVLCGPYYQIQDTVWLCHDRPWIIEFVSMGEGVIAFLQDFHPYYGNPLLRKDAARASVGEYFPYLYTDPDTGKEITKYGLSFTTTKAQKNLSEEKHTFRFENRLLADGTNEIHFLRDGEDLGVLERHHTSTFNGVKFQGTEKWGNGKDILVNYIFGKYIVHAKTFDLNYIQIWENGDSGEVQDYRTYTVHSQPSHTAEGKRTTHCSRCGGTTVEILPETHDEKIIPGYAATCTEAGLTDGSVCTTCNKTVRKQETIPAKGHAEKVTPGTVTCTEAGTTDRIECTVCKLVLQEVAESEALGHAWDEGVVTKEPGCKETGVKTFTCAHDAGHTYTEELPVVHVPVPIQGFAPTCTSVGLTPGQKCDLCAKILETQKLIPETGHTETTDPPVEPTCTAPGLTEGKHCSVCNEILTAQQEIPVKDHSEAVTPAQEPTCTEPGLTAGTHCSVCNEILTAQQEIPALGHDYVNYYCTRCQQEDSNMPKITRISGKDRHETAFKIADMLKAELGTERFSTIIIASGVDSADALAGSYLAARTKAPILLSRGNSHTRNLEYIQANLAPGGTVYILGGTAAVPEEMENLLKDNNILYERLKGKTRFDTNLAILDQAGVVGDEILVSTGYNFADSLSASASGKPILLVHTNANVLTDSQKVWLEGQKGKTFTIIGGTGAVSAELETALQAYGTTTRLKGSGREATSVEVAKKFFTNPDTALLAYSRNFPDGLCGGPLAYAMGAPLLLVNAGKEADANGYVSQNGIAKGYILGGTGVISDETARTVFGLSQNQEIPKQ